MSPTLPVAKLRLYRDLLDANTIKSKSTNPLPDRSSSSFDRYNYDKCLNNINYYSKPTFERSHSSLERSSLYDTRSKYDRLYNRSHLSYPSTPTKTGHFSSYSHPTSPTPPLFNHHFSTYLQSNCNPPLACNQQRFSNYYCDSSLDKMKSSSSYFDSPPNKAFLNRSFKMSSPRDRIRSEIKYFVDERKKLLGLNKKSFSSYPKKAEHSSDSDINALMNLYSNIPDPVMERIPPPGMPNYQRVPQAYLKKNASYPFLYESKNYSSSPSLLSSNIGHYQSLSPYSGYNYGSCKNITDGFNQGSLLSTADNRQLLAYTGQNVGNMYGHSSMINNNSYTNNSYTYSMNPYNNYTFGSMYLK